MKAAGILDFATNLHNPSFAKIAKAAGLFGARAEYPEELVEAKEWICTRWACID